MIREAAPEDCINLVALSLSVWLDTYCIDGIKTENSKLAFSKFTPEYFLDLLKNKDYKILVFEEGVYLRAYIIINLYSFYQTEENGFEIDTLYVQSHFHGNGIGKNLISEVKHKYGNSFWLYTWVRNKSLGFYKKLGFKDIAQYDFQFENETIENRVLIFKG